MAEVPTKSPFWRMLGAAFACQATVVLATFAPTHQEGGAVFAVVTSAVVFGIWGAIAPRSAAVVFGALLAISTWNVFWIGVFDTPWRLLLVPIDALAVLFAVRAYKRASAYVDSGRHRKQMAHDYDLWERWQPPS